MKVFERVRKALVAVCAQALPAESVAISVGLPSSNVIRIVNAVAPRVTTIEAISSALLDTYPGLSAECSRSHKWLILGQHESETFYGLQHDLGQTRIFMPQAAIRAHALRDILDQVAALSFLHVGPIPGHIDLLISVLAQLADMNAIVWLDLPPDSTLECQNLLKYVSEQNFEVFGLSRQRLVVLPGNLLPGEAEGLLLLPRHAWIGFGLRRVAQERRRDDQLKGMTSDLVIPTERQASHRVMTRLHPAYTPLPEVHLPKKIFLPSLSYLFVPNAAIESSGGDLSLVVSQTTAEIIFMPVAAGMFDIGIVLSVPPDTSIQANLTVWMGATRLSFIWHGEWWQFRCGHPVLIEDAHRPVSLKIMRPSGTGTLHIKGLELQLQERLESEP